MSVIARALTALRPRALLPMRGFVSVLQPSCSTLAPLGTPFRALSTSTAELPPVSFKLNTLRDLDGSWQHEKRVGRGKGSGYGKNSGRGQKGQRRKGGVRLGFEGGQTPVYRRVPKTYFLRKSRFPSALQPLNLGKLQLWLDMGRLDASKTITMKHILDSGIVGKFSTGVKVLARDADHLTTAVHLEVTEASQAAIAAIEAKGGSVVTVYHSALSLRALLHPHKFDIVPKTPAPPPKSMPYYLSDENRGYLSRLVQLKALQKSA